MDKKTTKKTASISGANKTFGIIMQSKLLNSVVNVYVSLCLAKVFIHENNPD